LVTTHVLPEAAFTALARCADDPDAIQVVRDAQLSKQLMLLHSIAEAADGLGDGGPAAFRAAYELLARIQATDPGAAAWLLGLPHLGGWVHDCLIHFDQGSAADFGHFACAVAAAAVRTGFPFELDVPVQDDRILLPGLGYLKAEGSSPWITLRCDGHRVTDGDRFEADWRQLVPDEGQGTSVPLWSGTPMIRAVADGLNWNTLLETDEPYLDRYSLPMSGQLSPKEIQQWRHRLQHAWEVVVRHHRWAAGPIANGISVVIPLTPYSDTDLVSATTPAAFGAIATSWPPDPVTLAETLIHEFQHVKLCGLMDMVPMVESRGDRVYAPWRQDPRPAGGLLQGIYAHLGIVRFWAAQRHVETSPDEILRAQVHLARWGPAVDLAVQTLLETGCLTPDGTRFAKLLRTQGREFASDPVPAEANAIAADVALDHWLTWQIRHVATDPGTVARLAAAYRNGEPCPEHLQPATQIGEDLRKVGSAVRSRLQGMRYLAPARYRELCADGFLPLSEPDRLLLAGSTDAAVHAYRDLIACSAEPEPDAWIGLGLALHRRPVSPYRAAFATCLALMFDVHARLGQHTDPLDLAGWFA
jgi:HEXXH motif-containing protein